MNYNSELIVLHTTKSGEKSIIVHCLSSLWGRRSFICSVGKTFSLANFQTLSILEATVVSNPKSDLWRLKEVKQSETLNSIRTSVVKSSIAMFISELLYRTIYDEIDIFSWCKKSIITLNLLESDYSNYHLRFLMELISTLGFYPRIEDITPFAGQNLKEIQTLLNADITTFLSFPLTGKKRSEIAESLLSYLGHHTQTRINIRSLEVLKTLF